MSVLTRLKIGSDKIEIDEEEFIIKSNYLDEDGEIGLMMCLYEKGDNHVVIEFKKTKGD